MSRPGVIAVSHAAFESFLRLQETTHWNLTGGESSGSSTPSPCALEDVMSFIKQQDTGKHFVYVFSEQGPIGAYGAATEANWSEIPTAGVVELQHYVVGTVDGSDFLYFACSAEAGSSGNYTTLLPARASEHE